jgi:hypothetical protein
MAAITRESLQSLEAYAKARPEFRRRVMAHKKRRTVRLGEHLTLLFEDELTIRYQIQEMLRIERIFDDEGIRHELDTYGPLVPDGRNLKATLLIEYADVDERRKALARMRGIEDQVWLRVSGHDRVLPIADEDMERENDDKTSSVHFLRWELDDAMARAFKGGASLAIGVEHPGYRAIVDPVGDDCAGALRADLD